MTDHWSLPIDAESATPVYVQVAQQLQRRIESGELRRGSALPAERDFAAQLGISRVTVRQALALLEKQGLLLRKHGSGTFVTPPARPGEMPSRPLGLLSSFSEDVRSRGQRPGARVLAFERGRPTAHEALSLALSPTESVYRVRRLRTANDEPLAIEESTLPATMVGVLTAADVTDTSLYALLRRRNLEPSRGIRHLRAVNADLTLAAQLNVPVGAALLATERVSWTAEGLPIEYARAQYRGDRFDFVMELHGDNDT
ncbi:GntR family transcriptional regulator [Deinococcus metalli]|uniref:GntR family transcriptional regulator n=1 Tax=Deinococcus metalli TaxID=1141878 RepID=A0A7W8KCX5_9DEIO|nr:GntR family transcriptional regulator [Deinococcus metalli]MBB5375910.1 GntR family transcriptional regulator [Deinococcus metalli]GHF36143.1 GntR family transcriptional regulator [Deinococcus metalli]